MAALDNANPTILNLSQLPTRQKRIPPRNGPDSKYNDVIFSRPSYLSRPFYDDEAQSWPRADYGAGDDDDDYAAEPIDEQEIYGMHSP